MRKLMLFTYIAMAATWSAAVGIQAVRHGWHSPYFGMIFGLIMVPVMFRLAFKILKRTI